MCTSTVFPYLMIINDIMLVPVIQRLLDHFFSQIVARANIPDFYDETLSGDGGASDVLQLMAQLTGHLARTVQGTCHFLAAPVETDEAMDVKHVALCFAAEVVHVNPQAGASFAAILCRMMQKFESPLLMADAGFKFFRQTTDYVVTVCYFIFYTSVIALTAKEPVVWIGSTIAGAWHSCFQTALESALPKLPAVFCFIYLIRWFMHFRIQCMLIWQAAKSPYQESYTKWL